MFDELHDRLLIGPGDGDGGGAGVRSGGSPVRLPYATACLTPSIDRSFAAYSEARKTQWTSPAKFAAAAASAVLADERRELIDGASRLRRFWPSRCASSATTAASFGHWTITLERHGFRRDMSPAAGMLREVRLLEIGGGREPLLTPRRPRAASRSRSTTSTPASWRWRPALFDTAQFNVAGDFDPKLAGRFDLIFSRMVFEHVHGAPRAWSNMCALLAPGGVALAFHPTLYAPPFVINWLAPEALTARVLRLFFPDRHQGDYPKFPPATKCASAILSGSSRSCGAAVLVGAGGAVLGAPLLPAHSGSARIRDGVSDLAESVTGAC